MADTGTTAHSRKAGGVKCWGFHAYGQLGDGTRSDSKVPVDVDFATHQTIVVGASEPAGTIASGDGGHVHCDRRPAGTVG